MLTASICLALFVATSVLPMTKHHLQTLDTMQRNMLIRIIDWRRIDREDST